MQHRIKKVKRELVKKNEERRLALLQRGNANVSVISCRRKELNHHLNQSYSKFHEIRLASGGWKRNKSHGDHFTINSFSSVSLYHRSNCSVVIS